MKNSLKALCACYVLCAGLVAVAQNTRNLSLEEIWASPALVPKFISGLRSTADGKHYAALSTKDNKNYILKYDYVTGKLTDTLFSPLWVSKDMFLKVSSVSEYTMSPDETKILLSTEVEPIYRRSSRQVYYIYDRNSHQLTPLSDNGKQQNAAFSPDGSMVAFFRDNNLFLKDIKSNTETQVTTDGKVNEIINGHADWVYEEEFEIVQSFYWSPDGSRLAYYKFDESKVKEFQIAFYGGLYPREYAYKYPKAGEDNSVVGVYLYDVKSRATVKIDVGSEKDQYIPRVQWTASSDWLAVQRMNRHQNKLEILLADMQGRTHVIYKEESPTYIDVSEDLTFLKDKKRFIFSSSKNGFNHLYLFDMDGKQLKQITSGNWEVTKFYGYDEVSGRVFYQSAEESPMERYVYSASLDGKAKKKLTPSKGTNDAAFSESFQYFINTWSDANTPFTFTLHSADGKPVKVLEDNAALKQKLASYTMATKRFFSFSVPAGVSLNGWMLKPANFDSTRKYPVYMFVYGGPGSQTVSNSWDSRNGLWYQLLAQKGYIVVSVDNRGTGARGDAFKKCTYMNLGKLETEDQVESAKYLGGLPYVDAKRIGIQGWSYGGYMTSLCMTKGDEVFRTGIAVAPVTNWKYYDSIYTERYLQTPRENPKGYEDNSPINFAEALKGKFLLVHGTADDNVHYQNSMDFVAQLVKANKSFEMFSYPNKNHSIAGGNTRLHLYTMMTDFILKNL